MNILLVDDHKLLTIPIKQCLIEKGHTVCVAETIKEAMRAFDNETFNLALLDLNLPDGLGTTLLQSLKPEILAQTVFLILSGTSDPDEIAIAMDQGALGFVSKSTSLESLFEALNQIMDHARTDEKRLIWHDPDCSFVPIGKIFPPGTVLSPREREVFRLLRSGLQDKQIAYELGRSIHTIRIQIRSILRKRNSFRREECLR